MQLDFQIDSVQSDLVTALQEKIDQKTKPLGALGKLEHLALRIGQIQHTLEPSLHKPHILVFAGDHGIAADGVSPYPQEVTVQMVHNFLAGGAAINVFARQHDFQLYVVDAGVKGELPKHPKLLHRKIAPGTKNFRHEPAMTDEQCEQALRSGAEIVMQAKKDGGNIMAFGEMGIGNTSSASVLMSILGQVPLEECVGRGAGLDDAGLANKIAILQEAISSQPASSDPLTVLQTFGGFEIAMTCGAFLQAAAENMIILVDGFIISSALLVAARLYPQVLGYCLFGHLSDEPGHRKMLELLHGEPLLQFNLRLGEGTGAVLAYPLIESAVRFLNEMASFTSAGVSRKS